MGPHSSEAIGESLDNIGLTLRCIVVELRAQRITVNKIAAVHQIDVEELSRNLGSMQERVLEHERAINRARPAVTSPAE